MKPVTVILASVLLSASPAFAQTDPSQVGAVNATPGAMTGEDFAETAMSSDLYEIEAGQLASHKAESQAVRDFGQQMIAAHTESTRRLKSVTDSLIMGRRVTPPPTLDPRHAELYNRLQQANGEDFDQLYVRQQVRAHREALAVMEGYASNGREPKLARFATRMIPIIREHLSMLRTIRGGDE